jgi:hypothetical protein
MIIKKYMENRELIYKMAKKLDMIIEVTKEGKYIGKFRFINNKLHKLNETGIKSNQEMPHLQDRKKNE